MKPTPEQLLPIYRHNLGLYQAAGNAERVRVQGLLIERFERMIAKNGKGKK